jgi:branched-chain amino acid transport system substrate-binding protein
MARRAWGAVGIGLAVGLAAASPAQAAVKIGLLTDFSGTQGAFGALYKDGVDIFLKEHDGKLGGQDVQLIVEDGAGDPATTIAKAKKLVESDKIDVLFGPINSATGAALRPYIVEQKMPTLTQSTTDEVIDDHYMFRTSFAGNEDAYLVGYLPGKAGYKKAVIIASNYVSGQAAAKYFEQGFAAAGGTVVQKLMPRLGNADYAPFISQISSDADVIICFLSGSDAIRFMQQIAGYDVKLPLFGYTSAVDESLLPAEGDAAIGFIGPATYFSTIDTPENKAFVKEWNAMFPPDQHPSWPGMGGYIAAAVLDQALTKTGGNTKDTEALLTAFRNAQITTPGGSFRFDDHHNPIEPRYITQIRKVDGKVQPVVIGKIPEFIPVMAPPTLPPDLVLPKK